MNYFSIASYFIFQEEQNASSSANYDVEIIHSVEAHAGLRASQTAAEALESVSNVETQDNAICG